MDTSTKSLSHWMARNIQPHVRSHILGDIYSVLNLYRIYTLDNIAMLDKSSTEQLFEETSLSQGERSHLLHCVLQLKESVHPKEKCSEPVQTCKEPTISAQSNVLTGEVEDIDQQLYFKTCEKQALLSQLEDLSKEVTGLNSYGKVGSICGNCHRKGHRRTKCGFACG